MSANRFLSWLLLAGGALMAGVAGAQPIERWTQPDGARVLFVPSHQNPIIDIRIDVDAGSRREAPERLGVAALTNRLLASGTRKHDEEALSAAWADRSMQYGASVDQDRAAIRLRLLSDAAARTPAHPRARWLPPQPASAAPRWHKDAGHKWPG